MTQQYSVVEVPGRLDFRVLVEESLAGIYLIQGDHFLYVNPIMAKLFGYTPEELIAERSVDELVAPADRNRVRANLSHRFSGELETLQYSFQGLRRDGSTFDVEVRGRRTEVDGEPAVLGTLLDVTERRAELDRMRFLARAAELLDSSLDYEATLESLARLMIPSFADLCIIDIRYDGTVRRLVAGPEGEEGQGFTVEPAVEGATTGELSTQRVIESNGGVLLKTVPRHQAHEITARIPQGRSGDTDLPIRSVIIVPLSARGTNIGAILLATAQSGRTYHEHDYEFAREVARTAALAVDNARLYQEAQEAVHRREEVLAVVSHDLRNPLNTILMSTGMVLDQDRRQQGPLARIHRAAKQMERLIRDLLDMSAIDGGGFSVDPEPVRLEPVVTRTVEMLEEVAHAREITLQTSLSDGEVEIDADEDRLVQALANLISNAIKFTPAGGSVSISTRRRNGHVDLAVADSGPGIAEDQIGSVFERFWRGRKGGADGAGLGLAIVKGIAEAHGGRVRAESHPGEGATFHIELPTRS